MERSEGIFRTGDLPFASFLLSMKKLRFLECEGSGSIRFLFADPENQGDRLFLEYQSGAFVPAIAFYASVKYLRQQMGALDRRGWKYANAKRSE
jgi:hypothetical protein